MQSGAVQYAECRHATSARLQAQSLNYHAAAAVQPTNAHVIMVTLSPGSFSSLTIHTDHPGAACSINI